MTFAGHRPNRHVPRSRTAAVRAPIEECNETFMEEVNDQRDTVKPSTIPAVGGLKNGEMTKFVHNMHSKSFSLKNNTVPVTVNDPTLLVLEYNIHVHSKQNEEEKSSTLSSSSGTTLKQQDIAKYLNKLSLLFLPEVVTTSKFTAFLYIMPLLRFRRVRGISKLLRPFKIDNSAIIADSQCRTQANQSSKPLSFRMISTIDTDLHSGW